MERHESEISPLGGRNETKYSHLNHIDNVTKKGVPKSALPSEANTSGLQGTFSGLQASVALSGLQANSSLQTSSLASQGNINSGANLTSQANVTDVNIQPTGCLDVNPSGALDVNIMPTGGAAEKADIVAKGEVPPPLNNQKSTNSLRNSVENLRGSSHKRGSNSGGGSGSKNKKVQKKQEKNRFKNHLPRRGSNENPVKGEKIADKNGPKNGQKDKNSQKKMGGHSDSSEKMGNSGQAPEKMQEERKEQANPETDSMIISEHQSAEENEIDEVCEKLLAGGKGDAKNAKKDMTKSTDTTKNVFNPKNTKNINGSTDSDVEMAFVSQVCAMRINSIAGDDDEGPFEKEMRKESLLEKEEEDRFKSADLIRDSESDLELEKSEDYATAIDDPEGVINCTVPGTMIDQALLNSQRLNPNAPQIPPGNQVHGAHMNASQQNNGQPNNGLVLPIIPAPTNHPINPNQINQIYGGHYIHGNNGHGNSQITHQMQQVNQNPSGQLSGIQMNQMNPMHGAPIHALSNGNHSFNRSNHNSHQGGHNNQHGCQQGGSQQQMMLPLGGYNQNSGSFNSSMNSNCMNASLNASCSLARTSSSTTVSTTAAANSGVSTVTSSVVANGGNSGISSRANSSGGMSIGMTTTTFIPGKSFSSTSFSNQTRSNATTQPTPQPSQTCMHNSMHTAQSQSQSQSLQAQCNMNHILGQNNNLMPVNECSSSSSSSSGVLHSNAIQGHADCNGIQGNMIQGNGSGVVANVSSNNGGANKTAGTICSQSTLQEAESHVDEETPRRWAILEIQRPQAISEYANSIFKRLMREEAMQTHTYARHPHTEVKEKMRGILVDWLVEVHAKFALMPETLFLTVSTLDRFLQAIPVKRVRLQEVGVTCLFIASKYEEIHPPEIRDVVYITDRSSSREEILETEIQILNALNFKIGQPTVYHFLLYFGHLALYSLPFVLWPAEHKKAFYLASYTIETTLLNTRIFMKFLPSKLAAAALFMSKKILRVSPSWPPILLEQTPYSPSTLKMCAKELVPLVTSNTDTSLNAVRTKYASEEKMSVSNIYFHM